MDLNAAVTQLRTYAPMFSGNVAGAAQYERAVADQVWLGYPSAYVVPLLDEATPNQLSNALRQNVVEHVGIIVVFDNSADRRGQTVTELYDSTRTALWAALLNWRIDPVRASRGLEYSGGQLLEQNFAWLKYQWEFALQLTITDELGFQVPAVPLTEIDATFQKSSTTEDYAAADIQLPQS